MKIKGKKSQHELIFIIFQLLMIAAVFAFLMFYVSSLREQSMFKKFALARDLAFITNTVYAAPGNLEYTYYAAELNLSEFDYSFDEQLVNVFEQGRETVYPYGDDLLFDYIFFKLTKPEVILFQNKGYFLTARKETEPKPNLFKYPYVEIKEKGEVMIGFYNENPLANQIAAELNVNKEGVGRITSADILIIAEIDEKNPKTLKIEIPAALESAGQSRKFASLIINNALERGNIDYVFIIPSSREELSKAKIAVYISLGKDIPIIDISQLMSKSLDELK